MIAEFNTAIATGKSAVELIKALNSSANEVAVQVKAGELSIIMADLHIRLISLMDSYAKLEDANKELRKKLDAQEEWEETESRYQLTALSAGAYARLYQPQVDDIEPEHMLCADCFERRQKSLLHRFGYNSKGTFYKCHTCNSEVVDVNNPDPNDKPSSGYVPVRRRTRSDPIF